VCHQLPKSTACKMCSKFFPEKSPAVKQVKKLLVKCPVPGHVRIGNISLARGSMSMVGRRLDLVDGHRARLQYFSSLPYPHLIQEYVLRLSEEEALQGSFHLSPCQWTRLISSYSAATVSHQLATATTLTIPSGKTTVAACLPMVCTCSLIRTVAITIPSRWSFTYHEGHRRRRRIVPLWRLCTKIQICKQ
jgi:hypothetical protein